MIGLVLIAAGLILMYAIQDTTDAVNLHTIGVILLIVGIVSMVFEAIYYFYGRDRWTDYRRRP